MTSKNQAKTSLNSIKMQAANEVGVPLKDGYNGDLTSRQAGSIGGQMVKRMIAQQQMTKERANRTVIGHKTIVKYDIGIIV